MPEFSRRGRDRRKLQYSVLAAAAAHGRAEPDLLEEIPWWQADDVWQYALLAAVLYVRAADRAGRARGAVLPGAGRRTRASGQVDLVMCSCDWAGRAVRTCILV